MQRSSGLVRSPAPWSRRLAELVATSALTGVVGLAGLAPVSAAEVRVLSPAGDPAEAAELEVVVPPGSTVARSALASPLVTARTDGHGRARLELPAVPGALLLVDHPSGRPAALAVDDPAATVEVQLEAGRRLASEVRGFAGELVGGRACATWEQRWPAAGTSRRYRRCADVGADGRFELSGLGAVDVVELGVEAAGFLPRRDTVRLDDPRPLRLEPGVPITGRVIARPGEDPVPGARVATLGESGGSRVRAGRDGTFELAVASLPVELEVRADGFRPATLRVERPDEPITIPLEPGETVEGIVLGEQSLPAEDVWMWTERLDGERVKGRRHRLDDAGRGFLTTLSGPGTYRLRFHAEGHAERVLGPYEVAPRESLHLGVVGLRRGAGVSGRLIDAEDGQPVSGAVVEAVPEGLALLDAAVRLDLEETISDEAGRFEIYGLPAGRYELRTSHRRYATHRSSLRLEPDESSELGDLPLTAGVRLEARLVDRDGEPRPGLTLQLFDPERSTLASLASGVSDGDGEIALALAPGLYRMEVEGERLLLTQELEIPAGEEELEREIVVGGVDVRGVVLRDGEPVGGGHLSLSPLLDPAQRRGKVIVETAGGTSLSYGLPAGDRTVTVSDDGRFRLRDAPAGLLWVTHTRQGERRVHRRLLVPDRPEAELVVELAGEPLAGRVTGADSLQPIEGAFLRLLEESGRNAGHVTTDAEGAFAFADLPAGRYRLEVGATDYRTEMREVVLAAGRSQPLEISLEPGGSGELTVTLLRDDGSPGWGALATLLDANGAMVRSLPTDRQGRREFDRLASGRYFLAWADPVAGVGLSPPIDVVGGEEVRREIALAAGSRVEVVCAAPGCGEKAVDFLAVYASSGHEIGAYLPALSPALRLSGQGSLRLGRLSPGSYRLQVWLEGEPLDAGFEVPGGERPVRVALPID